MLGSQRCDAHGPGLVAALVGARQSRSTDADGFMQVLDCACQGHLTVNDLGAAGLEAETTQTQLLEIACTLGSERSGEIDATCI